MLKAVIEQIRIVYTLLIRDIKMRSTESPIGPLSAILEPILIITLMSFLFAYVRMRSTALGEYLMLFFMTGLMPIHAMKTTLVSVDNTIRRHRMVMFTGRASPFDMMVVAFLFSTILYIILVILITEFFVIVLDYEGAENMVGALVPIVGNALIGGGLGAIIAVIALFAPFVVQIIMICIMPIQLLSGMFFTAESASPVMLKYLVWNPFFHSTELMRMFYYAEYTSPIFDPYYYFGWVIACTAIGLATERLMRHRLLATA